MEIMFKIIQNKWQKLIMVCIFNEKNEIKQIKINK